jgi:hypothetical protein
MLEHPQYLDEHGNYFCAQCLSLAGTCHLCSFGNCCDFETNPINLPKQEQKVIRQGNMTMQTVEKGEARIRETCLRNCPCFSEEFGCLRENGTCGKYEGVF